MFFVWVIGAVMYGFIFAGAPLLILQEFGVRFEYAWVAGIVFGSYPLWRFCSHYLNGSASYTFCAVVSCIAAYMACTLFWLSPTASALCAMTFIVCTGLMLLYPWLPPEERRKQAQLREKLHWQRS